MMSEAAKVRVVRCPKCEIFIPEITDFCVYQCGGCGAVLKAENSGNDSDNSQGIAKKLADVSEKRMMDSSNNELSLGIGSSSQAESIPRYRDGKNSSPLMNITQDFEDLTLFDDSNNGLVRSKAHLVNRGNAVISEVEAPWERPNRMDSEGRSRHNDSEYLRGRMTSQDFYARDNYYHDPKFKRQTYHKRYAETFPGMKAPEMEGGYGLYPQAQRYDHGPIHVQEFEEPPLRPHMVRRRSVQAYTPGVPYMDEMRPFPSNLSNHHPFIDRRSNVLLPPAAYRDKYANVSSGKMFDYYRENPRRFEQQQQQLYRLRPVAGGAPFMICHGCFELLLLPERIEAKGCNNEMKCGACFTAISLVFSKEESSVPSIGVEVKDNRIHNTVVPSDDCYHEFRSKNKEVVDLSMGGERAGECTEAKGASEVEIGSEKSSSHKSERKSAEDSQKKKECESVEDLRPPAGSPLLKHFEFSNKYYRGNLNHMEEGNNRTSQPKNEEVLSAKKKPEAVIRKQDSSSATEIDLSSIEFYNTGTTYDSGESLLSGALKRSVKENVKVTVNGHAITDELVKKAQKLAGKIQPGNYWYDFRAGFWGVEGGPCLGVIPPYIEEFNYLMPVNCAGGNTNIFVNGRELHHKDLNLLAGRGLPTEIHKSYVVEISGSVFDEGSGEELESLGKLAPSVERAKHGFGMNVPKVTA